MTAFWAQVVAAFVGALVTGGVKIFGSYLLRRTDNRAPIASEDDD